MTKTEIDPQIHDTKLAHLYFNLADASQQESVLRHRIIHMTGPITRLFGKDTKRGWGSEDVYHSFDESRTLLSTMESREASIALTTHEVLIDTIKVIRGCIKDAEDLYTGWSRFFLVTSSAGHIHSSMHCDTCYASTTYGWLPELSGLTEADAVTAHGEVLCTRCFWSAPTGNVSKISAAKAATLAWSPDREEKIAKAAAAKEAKAEAKVKKAASKLKYAERIGPKINAIVDRYGWIDFYKVDWDEFGYQASTCYGDIQAERKRQMWRAA